MEAAPLVKPRKAALVLVDLQLDFCASFSSLNYGAAHLSLIDVAAVEADSLVPFNSASSNHAFINGVAVPVARHRASPDLDVAQCVAAKPFTDWVASLEPDLRVQHVTLSVVDFHGRSLGFVKVEAKATLHGRRAPCVAFVRGGPNSSAATAAKAAETAASAGASPRASSRSAVGRRRSRTRSLSPSPSAGSVCPTRRGGPSSASSRTPQRSVAPSPSSAPSSSPRARR